MHNESLRLQKPICGLILHWWKKLPSLKVADVNLDQRGQYSLLSFKFQLFSWDALCYRTISQKSMRWPLAFLYPHKERISVQLCFEYATLDAVAYSTPVAGATAVFLIYQIGQESFAVVVPLGMSFEIRFCGFRGWFAFGGSYMKSYWSTGFVILISYLFFMNKYQLKPNRIRSPKCGCSRCFSKFPVLSLSVLIFYLQLGLPDYHHLFVLIFLDTMSTISSGFGLERKDKPILSIFFFFYDKVLLITICTYFLHL